MNMVSIILVSCISVLLLEYYYLCFRCNEGSIFLSRYILKYLGMVVSIHFQMILKVNSVDLVFLFISYQTIPKVLGNSDDSLLSAKELTNDWKCIGHFRRDC